MTSTRLSVIGHRCPTKATSFSLLSRALIWTGFFFLVMLSEKQVEAVDKGAFKRCDQSGFCVRNRDFAKAEGESPYHLLPETIIKTDSSFKAEVLNFENRQAFVLSVYSYAQDTVRVKFEEKQPLRPRYQVPDVILEPESLWKAPAADASGRLFGVVEIQHTPLLLRFFDRDATSQDNPYLEVNSKQLLNMEHLRNREIQLESDEQSQNKAEKRIEASQSLRNRKRNLVDDSSELEELQALSRSRRLFSLDGDAPPKYKKVISGDQAWEENFSSHHDSKPYGPSSVSLDFVFRDAQHVYGIPEHASSLSLKTTVGVSDPYRLYNLDVFEYVLDVPMALYGSVPLMLAQRSKGKTSAVFWLNSSETWIDILHLSSDVQTHWFSESGIIDFFVFSGPTPKDVSHQYAKLTGFPQLPPIFSIAYHQCRWNYKDQPDVLQVNEQFDVHDLPMDVIWLDIEHTDAKKYFTWDENKFPDPIKMIDTVAERGRKMVTIVDPHIKKDDNYYLYQEARDQGLFVKKGSNDHEGFCWPGASMYPDFSNPAVREWWSSQFAYNNYKKSTPALFTWNDMNEPSVFNGPEVSMHKDLRHHGGLLSSSPSSWTSWGSESHPFEHRDIHNLYGFWLHMATFNGLIKRNSDQNSRPFVLSRAFFAGSQRYGAIWTGDNAAQWSHLQAAQPMLLSISLAGIPFCGADVGGFFGNPGEELVQRWYQAGAFHPFFRGHAHHDTKRREPYLYSGAVLQNIRNALRLRYSLLPFWYSRFYEASVTGVAPMRPLFFEYPEDRATFEIEDQFLVGTDLLVKPISEEGQRETSVYFPGSQPWFDIYDFSQVKASGSGSGHRQIISSPLDRGIPAFQRGGSIIPRRNRPRRSSSQMVNDPFTLHVALDSDQRAEGDLYLDDGASFDHLKGVFHHRKFIFENNSLRSLALSANQFDDQSKIERVIILGLKSLPTSVLLNGSKLEFYEGPRNSLFLRKPFVSIVSDWKIDLVF